MATVTGRLGDPYATQSTVRPGTAPVSLNVSMPAGKCPSGAITFSDVEYKGGSIWGNYWAQTNHAYNNTTYNWKFYLCDSAGNNAVEIMTVPITGNSQWYGANYTTKTGSSALATGLTGKALYLKAVKPSMSQADLSNDDISFRGVTNVVITYADSAYNITTSASAGGSLSANYSAAAPGTTVTLTPSANTGYYLTGYTTSPSLTISNNKFTMPSSAVSITANFAKVTYTVTTSASAGGSLSANRSTAQMGDTVTLTPSASTGYYFTGYTTSPTVTIGNNAFTMPASNVTVTANFAKITYSISKAASPAAGGTVTTSANSATMGTSVTVSQTPATGYYFNGWTTSPANLISSGSFTMPAQNVSITANYLRRSTASLNKTTLEGGGTAVLTISTESSAYTHKYNLSFGTGMTTGNVNVAAGTTSVTINIPLNWSAQIPNATSKTGGTLTVYTYSGSTQIGSYTISSLTYSVPASVKPTMGTLTLSIARTIGGTTYANVGAYYVQNKCGVRTQASASGQQSATITSLKVAISGYSGTSYNKTVSAASVDFTSGLLTISGNTTITVTATDSRGRTNSISGSITVTAYARPSGSLSVWRVNNAGTRDDMGTYGKYSLTRNYTAVGSNSLTSSLSITGMSGSASNPATSGDLLPGSRKTFAETNEYTVNLTLTDSFETVTIQVTLPSARFIIYVDSTGNKLGFMKVTNKTIPSGKNRTVEFSADTQIYIGDQTLEDYIRSIT